MIFQLVQERHEMVLDKTHKAGAEEWCCQTCGRRLLFSWSPNYKKIVLDVGNNEAAHAGGKGGIVMGDVLSISTPNGKEQLKDLWREFFGDMNVSDSENG